MGGRFPLHVNSALNSFRDTIEYDEQRVPGGLDDLTAVALNLRINQIATERP
jgi:hypothetical protein